MSSEIRSSFEERIIFNQGENAFLDICSVDSLQKDSEFNAQDKDINLVVTAVSDNEEALQTIKPETLKTLFDAMDEKKCTTLFTKVSSIEELHSVLQMLKERGNRIQTLWIRAHGCRNGFTLSNDEFLYQGLFCENVSDLKEPLSLLEKDATIILSSCDTGLKPNEYFPNIAQKIASVALGRLVIAPTSGVREKDEQVSVDDHGRVIMEFNKDGKDITTHSCYHEEKTFGLPSVRISSKMLNIATCIAGFTTLWTAGQYIISSIT